jgi:hypothetical protein
MQLQRSVGQLRGAPAAPVDLPNMPAERPVKELLHRMPGNFPNQVDHPEPEAGAQHRYADGRTEDARHRKQNSREAGPGRRAKYQPGRTDSPVVKLQAQVCRMIAYGVPGLERRGETLRRVGQLFGSIDLRREPVSLLLQGFTVAQVLRDRPPEKTCCEGQGVFFRHDRHGVLRTGTGGKKHSHLHQPVKNSTVGFAGRREENRTGNR